MRNNAKQRTVIVDYNCYTPCGKGIDSLWKYLINNKTAISVNNRFNTQNMVSSYSAICPDLINEDSSSYPEQMLNILYSSKNPLITSPDSLILGTTVGEIDNLEKSLTDDIPELKEKSKPKHLLNKCCNLFNTKKGMHISSACASSTVGIIQAAQLIEQGKIQTAVVIGCDAVSEFVMSGFSALLALGKEKAKPFDENRDGLTIGESAAYVCLVSEEYAMRNNLTILGYISGGGISNDSNHITGPSRDGSGLARAINSAIRNSNIDIDNIDSISAHGTATRFNDSMEMKAFKAVFKTPVPTYSVKGCIGHTMGAAGILEVITALKSFTEQTLPPTVGTTDVDPEALGWVSTSPVKQQVNSCLSVNSGFGGINAAVIIQSK